MSRTLLISLLFLLLACSQDSAPENLLSGEKMVSVLIDAHLAEAGVGVKGLPRDSGQVIFYDYMEIVYKNHQITAQDFRDSYEFYKTHPEQFDEIYAAVVDSLSLREGTMAIKVQSGDSTVLRRDSIK